MPERSQAVPPGRSSRPRASHLMLVSRRHMSVTLAGLSLAGGGPTWELGSYLHSRRSDHTS